MRKILVVDDEQEIREVLKEYLEYNEHDGFEAVLASDGLEAIKLCENQTFDLVIMDIMMPKMDGMSALKEIRKNQNTPIIVLSARDQEYDKLFCFEMGADDYVTKPFSMVELLARVKANTRRTVSAVKKPETSMKIGDILIDTEAQAVMKNDAPLDLTQREYEIILYFAKNPSKVISREELMEKVWGYDYYGDLRAVDVAMRRLREKIEDDPSEPKLIITKRGVGYYLGK